MNNQSAIALYHTPVPEILRISSMKASVISRVIKSILMRKIVVSMFYLELNSRFSQSND